MEPLTQKSAARLFENYLIGIKFKIKYFNKLSYRNLRDYVAQNEKYVKAIGDAKKSSDAYFREIKHVIFDPYTSNADRFEEEEPEAVEAKIPSVPKAEPQPIRQQLPAQREPVRFDVLNALLSEFSTGRVLSVEEELLGPSEAAAGPSEAAAGPSEAAAVIGGRGQAFGKKCQDCVKAGRENTSVGNTPEGAYANAVLMAYGNIVDVNFPSKSKEISAIIDVAKMKIANIDSPQSDPSERKNITRILLDTYRLINNVIISLI